MLKKLSVLSLLLTSISVFAATMATPLWHCTATSASKATWNWYGTTKHDAEATAQKQCALANGKRSCAMVCFPPQVYWRCSVTDTIPATVTPDSVNPTPPKQGVWYWSSFSQQIAINGARDACRHNSPFGGCYVDPAQCASS